MISVRVRARMQREYTTKKQPRKMFHVDWLEIFVCTFSAVRRMYIRLMYGVRTIHRRKAVARWSANGKKEEKKQGIKHYY